MLWLGRHRRLAIGLVLSADLVMSTVDDDDDGDGDGDGDEEEGEEATQVTASGVQEI